MAKGGIDTVLKARAALLKELHTLGRRREKPGRTKAESDAAVAPHRPDEQDLSEFAEGVADWVWEMDPGLRFTYLSGRFEEVTGLPPERFLGRMPLEAVNADPRDPRWRHHVADLVAQRPFRDFRFAMAGPSGRTLHLRVSGKPVFDSDGRFQGYRGVGSNNTEREQTEGQLQGHGGRESEITERKQIEEKLVATTARLKHLLHAGPAMIYSFRAWGDHAVIFVSDNVRQQLGYEPKQFLRDPNFWTEHIHPEDRRRVIDELSTLFDQGHHIQEYRFQHRDGTYRWMHDELRLVRDASGKPLEVIGYWVDATARKEAEQKLKEYAVKLERSNRELQDFAYVASHDLQEPLRKIEAFGDRLKEKSGDGLNEECRSYLDRMQAAAGRMRDLINDLLTYSRVTTKAEPFAPVELTEVANDVVSDLQKRIEETAGRVEIGPLPTIEADATQMRQLLQNLIGNALKFHKPDVPPVVEVAARLDRQEADGPDGGGSGGEVCVITVKDNGIGFDEKYLDRVFQIFQRLHGRGEYEGTGIGLATCRKIAERHGGRITATSTPGEGATFVVSLPATQINEEHADEIGRETNHHPDGR